jgi:hypothetical protein
VGRCLITVRTLDDTDPDRSGAESGASAEAATLVFRNAAGAQVAVLHEPANPERPANP